MELYIALMSIIIFMTVFASIITIIEKEQWRPVVKVFSIGSTIGLFWPLAIPIVILIGLVWAVKDRSFL